VLVHRERRRAVPDGRVVDVRDGDGHVDQVLEFAVGRRELDADVGRRGLVVEDDRGRERRRGRVRQAQDAVGVAQRVG
jgi:hypothetical protein